MRKTGSALTVAVLISAAACSRPAGGPGGPSGGTDAGTLPPLPDLTTTTTTAPTTTATIPPTTGAPTTAVPTTAPTTAPPPTSAPSPPAPPAPPTTRPAPPPPVPPVPPVPQVPLLRLGDRGPEVQALQERLQAQGFWLGAADGVYGAGTRHAVTALQKAAGLARDGVFGPASRAALDRGGHVAPASTMGHVIEVDLRRQIVIVADDGRATLVLDASTGAQPGSTPTGRYRIFRGVDGMDTGPYGPLYRPKYFNQGIAIHGYDPVPPVPASHGCVRITNAAIDLLWNTGALPNGTPVWVY